MTPYRRPLVLASVAVALFAVRQASAQPIMLFSQHETYNGQFGLHIGRVPDITGDGADDVVIGAENEDNGRGRVYTYNGATGQLIRTNGAYLPSDGEAFGRGVDGVPDVNGDGKGEIVIGTGLSRAILFNGDTGGPLREFPDQASGNGKFGNAVAGLPDVNGDGKGDVAVGAYGARKVFVFDGQTAALLHTLQLPPGGFQPLWFGWAVAGIADVTGDGRGDVLVGAPNPGSTGEAYVFSGATGALVHELPGTGNIGVTELGYSLAAVPDFTGDGVPDVIVGSALGLRAVMFNGATGAHVRTLMSTYSDPVGPETSYYGLAVAGLDDVNGDGLGDVVVTAPYEDLTGDQELTGTTYIYDGSDGTLLREIHYGNRALNSSYGYTATGLGDTDGDGKGDFVIGAYTHPARESTDPSGRAFLYQTSRLTFEERVANEILASVPASDSSDQNGDSVVDAADMATIFRP